MKFNRSAAVLSLLTAAALVLAACGGTTHASSPSPSAAPVQCGGKKQLKASGATAQENAMEQFVYAYVHACPGFTLDYNANEIAKVLSITATAVHMRLSRARQRLAERFLQHASAGAGRCTFVQNPADSRRDISVATGLRIHKVTSEIRTGGRTEAVQFTSTCRPMHSESGGKRAGIGIDNAAFHPIDIAPELQTIREKDARGV